MDFTLCCDVHEHQFSLVGNSLYIINALESFDSMSEIVFRLLLKVYRVSENDPCL